MQRAEPKPNKFFRSKEIFPWALVDLRLPDGDGIELMGQLKAISPDLQVIVFTGHGTIDSAVLATKKGAYHFVTKPFNLEEIFSLVDRALGHKNLLRENAQLKRELSSHGKFQHIIGQSPGNSPSPGHGGKGRRLELHNFNQRAEWNGEGTHCKGHPP